jgi:Na+/alanine symporter
VLFLAVMVFSPFLKGGLVWQLNDFANGLLLGVNIIAMFLLKKKFFNKNEN